MTTNSSTAVSGKDGKVVVDGTLLLRITQWSLSLSATETVWGDSSSGNFTNRKTGRKDATMSLEGKQDNRRPIEGALREGDQPKVVLFESASRYWVFPCTHVNAFNLVINQETKEVIGWTASAGADGQYYGPDDAGQPSESIPAEP